MATSEWSLPAAFDALASGAPQRDVLVWKSARRTYAEVARRSRGLGAFLRRRGLGIQRERASLERWECGQSTVGLVLWNCPEYVEAMLRAFRARAVPFNVNQHYRPEEIRGLFDMLDAQTVVYHRALGPRLAAATQGRHLVWIDVDDGSGTPPVPGSTPFEEAVAAGAGGADLPEPSPDDRCLVCTGGTTGSPKAVLCTSCCSTRSNAPRSRPTRHASRPPSRRSRRRWCGCRTSRLRANAPPPLRPSNFVSGIESLPATC